MSKIMYVKSGVIDSPVTKSADLDARSLKTIIGNRKLISLGKSLPTIGETSRLVHFVGPDHVVIEVDERDVSALETKNHGLYLVDNLCPADVGI